MTHILITGATGFVGQALAQHLLSKNIAITAAVRKYNNAIPSSIKQVEVGDLSANTDWSKSLLNIDAVIHLAAHVHIMDKKQSQSKDFQAVNTEGTLNLARQAKDAGVKRFIFISTIKVCGDVTTDTPFTEEDANKPTDSYALSKYETEQALLSDMQDMEIVIIRPPLVYGAGAKGNLLTMMRWMDKGIPLPLGSIQNKRSLVGLGNLVDLITVCIDHPNAKNQVFLVSDGNDLSTTELLQLIAKALHKPARLLPVPHSMLSMSLKLLGKKEIETRLCGSLQVDISKAKTLLDWTPPVNTTKGIEEMADAFLRSKANS